MGRGAPLDWSDVSEYRSIMEVNFFSVVQVTKACLPLLKQSQGRIIVLSSVAGLASAPLMSAYSASKHAVEAFTTAIRVELAPWGIKVRPCLLACACACSCRMPLLRTTMPDFLH